MCHSRISRNWWVSHTLGRFVKISKLLKRFTRSGRIEQRRSTQIIADISCVPKPQVTRVVSNPHAFLTRERNVGTDSVTMARDPR